MGNRIIKSKPTASTSMELNSTSYLSELPLDFKSKPTASNSKELNSTSYLSELPLDLIVLIASYCSMKDQRTLSHVINHIEVS